MSGPEHIETTDVLVVGCGPIGAVFSALLGKLSIRNVVLEKEKEITSDPRAITIDEDAIRVLQELGLHNKVYTEIGTCRISCLTNCKSRFCANKFRHWGFPFCQW